MVIASRRTFALGVSSGLLLELALPRARATGRLTTTAASTATEAPVPYSLDFDAYTCRKLNSVFHVYLSKKQSPSTSLTAAKALRPAARHIGKSTMEVEFQNHLVGLDAARLKSGPKASAVFASLLKAVAPSANPADFPELPDLSDAEIGTSLDRLRANGLAGTLQVLADLLEAQGSMPGLQNTGYSYQEHLGHATLHRACFFCDKKQWCSSFAAAIADTALLATIVGIICGIGAIATGGAGAIFCAAVWGTGVPASAVILAAMALYQVACGGNGLGLTPG